MKVVLADYAWHDLELEKRFFADQGIDFVAANCTTEEEVVEVAADADAIIAEYAPLRGYALPRLQNCKVIAQNATGFDNVDINLASKKGIWVCNVPGYCNSEVADHTLALLLACYKRVCAHYTLVKAGIWDFKAAGKIHRLAGQKLGIIGFGRIGREVARRAQSFDFQIVVYDPFIDPGRNNMDNCVFVDTLESLLEQADAITLHMPLTEDTRGMLSKAEFEHLKPGAVVINAARGALIDPQALLKALEKGTVSFAGLDVYETEPATGVSLTLATHPRVVATPHVAFYSEEAEAEVRTRAMEEVCRVLDGKEPLHPVNKMVSQ